jgi:hypothetical protein
MKENELWLAVVNYATIGEAQRPAVDVFGISFIFG